jgi:hypothetical protein
MIVQMFRGKIRTYADYIENIKKGNFVEVVFWLIYRSRYTYCVSCVINTFLNVKKFQKEILHIHPDILSPQRKFGTPSIPDYWSISPFEKKPFY